MNIPNLLLATSMVLFATVDGYSPQSPENNQPETWGPSCIKIDMGFGETYTLKQDYDLVVVKGGTQDTIFQEPLQDETVWSDNNQNGIWDGGPEDKGISHIIFCLPEIPEKPPVPPESEIRIPERVPPELPQTGF